MRRSAARAARRASKGGGMSPIVEHPDVRRMLLTMRGADPGGARHLLPHRRGDRPRPSLGDPEARRQASRARRAPDAGRQGLLHRHRRRGRLARRAGAWRHGLHRGDRRGAASARRAHRADLRGHERHPGDRPRRPASCRSRKARRSPRSSPACASTAQKLVGINARPSARWRRGCGTPSTRSTGRRNTCSAPSQTLACRRARGRHALSAPLRPRARHGLARRDGAWRRMRRPARARPIRRMRGASALARFFAENVATGASGLEAAITTGAASVQDAALALAS